MSSRQTLHTGSESKTLNSSQHLEIDPNGHQETQARDIEYILRLIEVDLNLTTSGKTMPS